MTEIFGWLLPENRRHLERLIAKHRVKTVLEIGTFQGLSASWFAERVEHVVCIDPFEGEWAPQYFGIPYWFFPGFRQNMIDHGLWYDPCDRRPSKVIPIHGKSWEVAEFLGSFDLIYIDGCHHYEAVCSDISLYLPKARAVLCGDDFKVNEDFGIIAAVTELVPNFQVDGGFWWWERSNQGLIDTRSALALPAGMSRFGGVRGL
jgi:hypothetical protein